MRWGPKGPTSPNPSFFVFLGGFVCFFLFCFLLSREQNVHSPAVLDGFGLFSPTTPFFKDSFFLLLLLLLLFLLLIIRLLHLLLFFLSIFHLFAFLLLSQRMFKQYLLFFFNISSVPAFLFSCFFVNTFLRPPLFLTQLLLFFF